MDSMGIADSQMETKSLSESDYLVRKSSQLTFTNFHIFLTTNLSSFTIFMLQMFTNFPNF